MDATRKISKFKLKPICSAKGNETSLCKTKKQTKETPPSFISCSFKTHTHKKLTGSNKRKRAQQNITKKKTKQTNLNKLIQSGNWAESDAEPRRRRREVGVKVSDVFFFSWVREREASWEIFKTKSVL